MATVLTANAQYLVIDGVAIQAHLMDVKLNRTNANVDVTRGTAGHEMVDAGMDQTTMDITVAYVIENLTDYKAKLRPGQKFYVEYGPEGNVVGKPRHYQLFKVDSCDFGQTAKKDAVKFSVKLTGAEAAVADQWAGATF